MYYEERDFLETADQETLDQIALRLGIRYFSHPRQ